VYAQDMQGQTVVFMKQKGSHHALRLENGFFRKK
jgi:hypothetical protein